MTMIETRQLGTTAARTESAGPSAARNFLAVALASVALCLLPLRSVAAPVAVAATPAVRRPLIVNGQVTSSFPATGALLLYTGPTTAATLYGACSGTLIGCRTFLTAAHCVCPDDTRDAAGCEAEGKTDPATLQVFLQQGGLFHVARTAINPDYRFATHGDVAVVTLAEPVTGIAPSAINTTRSPDIGTAGTIVGFGTTASGRGSTDDSGIKREGTVTTAQCPADLPNDTHVCWEFRGTGANGCEGDSGGPLLVDFGAGPVIAGVTSGGYSFNCLPPDTGFDADVFANRSWIASAAAGDMGTESCDLPAAGTALTTTFSASGELSASAPTAELQFDVAEGNAVLRVALNAQFGSGTGFTSESNDFDLFLRADGAPTAESFDCADTNPSPVGFCQITAPRPGTWHVLVRLNRGAGAFQVTATTFAGAATAFCTGDCNHDGTVTVDEVLTGIRSALGEADVAVCPALDANGDGVVTVDEVIAAITDALDGCP